ncbi:MAG: hypothetical protein ACP5EP_12235 [Acidobacteriaceae bacterium]
MPVPLGMQMMLKTMGIDMGVIEATMEGAKNLVEEKIRGIEARLVNIETSVARIEELLETQQNYLGVKPYDRN